MIRPEKIKYLREYYGYSQSYIADAVGIRTDSYKDIENGREQASEETYDKIMSAFHGALKPTSGKNHNPSGKRGRPKKKEITE